MIPTSYYLRLINVNKLLSLIKDYLYPIWTRFVWMSPSHNLLQLKRHKSYSGQAILIMKMFKAMLCWSSKTQNQVIIVCSQVVVTTVHTF